MDIKAHHENETMSHHFREFEFPPTSEKPAIAEISEEKPKGRFARRTRPQRPPSSSGGKRRLLAFSDSRQDAAYFSTYLQRHYGLLQAHSVY